MPSPSPLLSYIRMSSQTRLNAHMPFTLPPPLRCLVHIARPNYTPRAVPKTLLPIRMHANINLYPS